MTTQTTQTKSWTEDMTAVNPPTFTDDNSLLRPRKFHWLNRGHLREAGFFYTKHVASGEGLTRPWETAEVFKNEAGYKAAGVTLAPICYRQRPFVWIDGEDYKHRRFLAEWDGKSQFYLEVVCFVRGSFDIWMLTGDGMISQAFEGIFSEYKDGLLRYARLLHDLSVPLWAFWLPITGRKEANGQPRFDPTGQGGQVTLPELIYPSGKGYDALAETFKVGEAYLRLGVQVREMFDGWVKVAA